MSGTLAPKNPGYEFRVADAELDGDMKPAEIIEALSALTFPNSAARRSIGVDRETCRYIVERLRQPARLPSA